MSHPAAVPWLAHLRTDRRGLPVPFVNLWGEETTVPVDVRRDPHVDRDAVFQDDQAETVPDFTRQNMQRQRQCMVRGLCQVCGRPIPWSRRFLVVADLAVNWIQFQGKLVPTLTEPWLDARCADLAMRFCPALIRRGREEHLQLLPVTSKRHVQMLFSSGWVEGRFEEQTKAAPVVMWAKLAVLQGLS